MLGEPKHARRDQGPRLSAPPMSRPPVRGMVAGLGVGPLRAGDRGGEGNTCVWDQGGRKKGDALLREEFHTLNSTKFEIKIILRTKGTQTLNLKPYPDEGTLIISLPALEIVFK